MPHETICANDLSSRSLGEGGKLCAGGSSTHPSRERGEGKRKENRNEQM